MLPGLTSLHLYRRKPFSAKRCARSKSPVRSASLQISRHLCASSLLAMFSVLMPPVHRLCWVELAGARLPCCCAPYVAGGLMYVFCCHCDLQDAPLVYLAGVQVTWKNLPQALAPACALKQGMDDSVKAQLKGEKVLQYAAVWRVACTCRLPWANHTRLVHAHVGILLQCGHDCKQR